MTPRFLVVLQLVLPLAAAADAPLPSSACPEETAPRAIASGKENGAQAGPETTPLHETGEASSPSAAGDTAPLPEARALLERLLANQDHVDELRESYTYKVREIEYERKGKGAARTLRKKEEAVFQVYPSRKLFVRRLLEKDGRPLDAKEQREEDQRIEKLARGFEKKERERAERAARGMPARDDDDDGRGIRVRLQDLLRASRLRTLGREPIDGRSCLVIEIAGDPAFKARTREEKLVQALSGRAWVDEEDLQIARAEAQLDKFRIGGGLVATLEDASFAFEQRRVNGEVWLPTRAEAEFRGRVLLLKKLDGRSTSEFYGYERFGTDVGVAFGEPAGGEGEPGAASAADAASAAEPLSLPTAEPPPAASVPPAPPAD